MSTRLHSKYITIILRSNPIQDSDSEVRCDATSELHRLSVMLLLQTEKFLVTADRVKGLFHILTLPLTEQ